MNIKQSALRASLLQIQCRSTAKLTPAEQKAQKVVTK
jgi:hypothetical protein